MQGMLQGQGRAQLQSQGVGQLSAAGGWRQIRRRCHRVQPAGNVLRHTTHHHAQSALQVRYNQRDLIEGPKLDMRMVCMPVIAQQHKRQHFKMTSSTSNCIVLLDSRGCSIHLIR